MCIHLFFSVFTIFQAFFGNEVVNQFAVNTIPETLKVNANAVVRQHETTFIVKNKSNATERIHYAITILNEKAANHASIKVPYDKYSKINFLKGALYDKDGKEIKRLKSNDIVDVGGISQSSLVDDVRLKAARFTNTNYPITVEFDYEVTHNGLLFYPNWHPQDEYGLSVENASFKVSLPESWKLRYKALNNISNLQANTGGNAQAYTWIITDLPAQERKPFHPPLTEITPIVYTAPETFEIDGLQGSMDSWESFGKWINTLNQNKDRLSEPTITKLKQLVADSPDDYSKIKKVYNYLQGKTRYVSIQLGIGGWQPFEADYVDTNGYGDCKALSNYMHAMLKAIGIKSYYTLINGGRKESDILVDFPSNQFNHVILCVPMQKDTLWLECTSQTEAFGYSGSFTGNRHALIITPEGGKIARTPIYNASHNIQKRVATIKLDALGNGTSNIETFYSGLLQDELSEVLSATVEDQKEWLHKHVSFPSYTIQKFEFNQKKDRIPSVTEKLSISVNKCASISGKRIFITPNLLSQVKWNLPQDENRTIDIVNDNVYVTEDIISYQIPEGNFHPEYLPETQNITSTFGEYNATFKLEGNSITYTRTLKINKGRFPGKSYQALQQFYKKISQADKLQIVLASKT